MVRPTHFLFEIIPAFGFGRRVEISSGNLLVDEVHFVGKRQTIRRRQRTPSDDDWMLFWKAVQFLDVWSWKREYSPEDIGRRVVDGICWKVELKYDGRVMSSQGCNAYPAFESVQMTSTESERFDFLVHSIENLIGCSLNFSDE